MIIHLVQAGHVHGSCDDEVLTTTMVPIPTGSRCVQSQMKDNALSHAGSRKSETVQRMVTSTRWDTHFLERDLGSDRSVRTFGMFVQISPMSLVSSQPLFFFTRNMRLFGLFPEGTAAPASVSRSGQRNGVRPD